MGGGVPARQFPGDFSPAVADFPLELEEKGFLGRVPVVAVDAGVEVVVVAFAALLGSFALDAKLLGEQLADARPLADVALLVELHQGRVLLGQLTTTFGSQFLEKLIRTINIICTFQNPALPLQYCPRLLPPFLLLEPAVLTVKSRISWVVRNSSFFMNENTFFGFSVGIVGASGGGSCAEVVL